MGRKDSLAQLPVSHATVMEVAFFRNRKEMKLSWKNAMNRKKIEVKHSLNCRFSVEISTMRSKDGIIYLKVMLHFKKEISFMVNKKKKITIFK